MHGASQRLGQRARDHRQVVGERPALPRRHGDIAGEGARAVRAHQLPVAAEVRPAGGAAIAPAADNERIERDARAGIMDATVGQWRRCGSHDAAARFMAHDQRRAAQAVVAQIAAQLRAADADRGDLQQRLVRSRLRH